MCSAYVHVTENQVLPKAKGVINLRDLHLSNNRALHVLLYTLLDEADEVLTV